MVLKDGTAPELPAASQPGENRVARLCSQQRIWSAFAKRGLTRKAGPPVHDDMVDRQFTAEGPDRTWLTGTTEHPTAEGKLYLLVTWNQTARPATRRDNLVPLAAGFSFSQVTDVQAVR